MEKKRLRAQFIRAEARAIGKRIYEHLLTFATFRYKPLLLVVLYEP